MLRVASCLLGGRGMNLHVAIVTSCALLSACTLGLEQEFDVLAGTPITDGDTDVLFQLENTEGNAPESLEHLRVVIADLALGGGLYATSDEGNVSLELVKDEGTVGMVEPGDIIRVLEQEDGMNLGASAHGETKWINVMVLSPSQRSSTALTRSWQTVWSTTWVVGQ